MSPVVVVFGPSAEEPGSLEAPYWQIRPRFEVWKFPPKNCELGSSVNKHE